MAPLLPSYLRTLRKQWGLSQAELAELLGVEVSTVCKAETGARNPTIDLVLGAEVIFGHNAREIFPAAYEEVESEIMARAETLHEELQTRTDEPAQAKLRLLTEMIERANPIKP